MLLHCHVYTLFPSLSSLAVVLGVRILGWDAQDDENLTKPPEHSKDTACKLELSNFSETEFGWQSKFK